MGGLYWERRVQDFLAELEGFFFSTGFHGCSGDILVVVWRFSGCLGASLHLTNLRDR